VSISEEYYTIGLLARNKYSGNSLLKHLKKENALQKICGVLWVVSQKLKLMNKFTVLLAVLLPPSEYQDKEHFESKLKQVLKYFNTPTSEIRIKLIDLNVVPEGVGIYLHRRTIWEQIFRCHRCWIILLDVVVVY
jgi:hypothetical protein